MLAVDYLARLPATFRPPNAIAADSERHRSSPGRTFSRLSLFGLNLNNLNPVPASLRPNRRSPKPTSQNANYKKEQKLNQNEIIKPTRQVESSRVRMIAG